MRTPWHPRLLRSDPDASFNDRAGRVQGNLGGEDAPDTVRGGNNEGGLFAERAGWHLVRAFVQLLACASPADASIPMHSPASTTRLGSFARRATASNPPRSRSSGAPASSQSCRTMNRLADRLCFRTMFELTIPHDLDVPISLDFSVDRGAYRAQVYINGCVPGDASGCRRRPDARGLQSGGRLASSTRRPARSTASPSTRASSTRTAATS